MPDHDGAPQDGPAGVPDDSDAPADGASVDTPAPPGALAEVQAALLALAHRFDAESERAAARERVIDRQHADIERLRAVERVGAMRPLITDLCLLRNDLLRQATTLPADISAERVAGLLESFAVTVEESLLRCGVEVQPREVGGRFAPGRQQVARVIEVDDPDRDGTVAEIVQDGYAEIDGGRVVAPARVTVHRATVRDSNATKEHVDA
jgi:molecular chaperone GrpE